MYNENGMDERLFSTIIFSILDLVNKNTLNHNISILRSYKSKFLDLESDIKKGITDLGDHFEDEIISIPKLSLYDKLEEDLFIFINMQNDFYGNIVDGIDKIKDKDFNRDSISSTSRVLLASIPTVNKIRYTDSLQSKLRLIRAKYSYREFLASMPNVLDLLHKIIVAIDKGIALNVLFNKYKDISNKAARLDDYDDKSSFEEYALAQLEYLGLEVKFAKKSNIAIELITTQLKSKFDLVLVIYGELLKSIKGESNGN